MNRRTRKTVGPVVITVAAAAAIVLGRTAHLSSVQVAPGAPAAIAIDTRGAADRLASLVRVPTIAWEDESKRDVKAFDRILQVIEADFPRVHHTMARETIARWSLLYTWRGRHADLPPLILCAHLDVVPVEPGTEAAWTHPPFEGAVAGGSVWGRGALDDKAGVAGLLEAAEALIQSGFSPERTVYFAFGHNEEGGGDASGAEAIARRLEARGVRHAWLLDEGGLIYDQLAGARQPVALVGVAEKGFMNLEIVAHAAGGHAAMPPPETAAVVLARALDRIERHPRPARLDGAALEMFQTLAPDLAFPFRMAIANLWLMRPLVLNRLSSQPPTNALVRTTMAPTMLAASPKPNVLPATATAVVNVRMLPGDTADAVTAQLYAVIADRRIEIRRLGAATEASSISPVDTPQFAALARSIRAVYPNVLVAPYLTITGTDAHHYARIAGAYRFLPVFQPDALTSIHGTNEHLAIDAYERAIRIYATLLRALQ